MSYKHKQDIIGCHGNRIIQQQLQISEFNVRTRFVVMSTFATKLSLKLFVVTDLCVSAFISENELKLYGKFAEILPSEHAIEVCYYDVLPEATI